MHWITYSSNETGGSGSQVYVRPFQVSASGVPALGEGKWQVSKDGGNWARWRSDQEIIFSNVLSSGDAIFAALVKVSGAAFESGVPQQLFSLPIVSEDVTSDGQRFLIEVRQVPATPRPAITLVLNWPALLKK
jgi:hypothetical protein